MNYNDMLVGCVSGAIGIVAILAGVLNREGPYRLRPARWIEAGYGRLAARLFYVLLGALLIALGVAISQGYGLYR